MLIHRHPFHPTSDAFILLNESDMEIDETLKISTVCFVVNSKFDVQVLERCRIGKPPATCRDHGPTEMKARCNLLFFITMLSPLCRRAVSNISSSIFVLFQETSANASCSPPIMKGIASPHENDVLMGRGGKNNQHSGNEKLRELARERCEEYRVACKKVKSDISRELVRLMRQLDPPAR